MIISKFLGFVITTYQDIDKPYIVINYQDEALSVYDFRMMEWVKDGGLSDICKEALIEWIEDVRDDLISMFRQNEYHFIPEV